MDEEGNAVAQQFTELSAISDDNAATDTALVSEAELRAQSVTTLEGSIEGLTVGLTILLTLISRMRQLWLLVLLILKRAYMSLAARLSE
ncbi:MAG: hypothetical protein ACJASU_001311 [Cognaticolwellia sp.]